MIYVIPLLLVAWAVLSVPNKGQTRPACPVTAPVAAGKTSGPQGDLPVRIRETGDLVYVTVYFDRVFQPDSASPTELARELFDEAAAIAAKKPHRQVILEGESDPSSMEEKGLNKLRFQASFNYIMSKALVSPR